MCTVWPFLLQLIPVDQLPKFFKKWETYFIIIIFIIIQNAIAVTIYNGREEKLHALVFIIYICHI